MAFKVKKSLVINPHAISFFFSLKFSPQMICGQVLWLFSCKGKYSLLENNGDKIFKIIKLTEVKCKLTKNLPRLLQCLVP